jgi:type I restriction-modification system DNA methylase subunit
MNDELIGQFSPASFSEWCREKFDRFTTDPHPVSDAGDFEKAEIVGYVQALPDEDANRPLLIMAIRAGESINERSSRRRQFEFARKHLQESIDKPPAKVKGLFTQGLFAFYDSAGAFRLSLVSGRAEGKKLVYSDFKRQSFFIQPDRNNKTFRARMASSFITYQDLVNAFSVEALTKEFYNSLFAWYERAMAVESKITFPNDLARDDDDRNLLSEHLIRLITRLMFVWFIRQKDLIPEAIFDITELKRLLKDFNPDSPKQDHYYRAILQNLFFATLNCEIKERAFAVESSREENKEHYGVKLLYRYRDEFNCSTEEVIKLFRSVPFLNGGLFECLDKKRDDTNRSPVFYHDGFSREAKKRAHIPNNLFFDDQGLITLFARYDFTVDENAPNDTDVALDPELLGKVFENLLGAYNPETQETARKQSGSFYTPREIVNFMVDESIVAHIRTQTPEIQNPTIRLLLGEESPPDLPESLRRKLVANIYHCRILDPACGSGAFPMGLLLKMVHLLQRLDPRNTLWHEVVMTETEKALADAETLNAAEKSLRRQRIADSFDQSVNQPDYARKLYLIENCIFGVDIQPIAVQIAKLRTFITLVCNQVPDPSNVDGNYGMLPLPNLETKFVAANSLIGLSSGFAEGLQSAEGGSRLEDPALVSLRADLAEVRHQHFRARKAPDKNACRRRDRELRGRIKSRLVEIASKPDTAKIARYKTEIESFQYRRKEFESEVWKDVVQTQATLGGILDATGPVQSFLRIDINKDTRDRFDDDIRRLVRVIETEENRAKNKSAFQKEADTLAAWDPYDQNGTSSFFDPEWMFGFKGGFDIVIGNPPYVQLQSLKGNPIQQIYRNLNFKVYDANGDMYCLFYEMGIQVLSQKGHLCFITSNKWMRAGYGEKLRTFFLNFNPQILIDLGPCVFESATVDTNILLIEKTPNQRNTCAVAIRKERGKKQTPNLVLALKEQGVIISNLDSNAWSIGSDAEQALKAKIERLGKPLKKWDVKINFGIKTGLNEAFIIDKCTRDSLVAEDPKSAEILKPILRGRDIKRYNYKWDGLWLIATFPALKLRIDQYPAIKKYLIKFGKPRLEQSGKILQGGMKARKLTGNEWFETQDQIAYYPELMKEKLVWKRIGSILRFAYDRDNMYCQDSTCIMTGKNLKYLCGYMNSKLGNRLLFDKAPKTGTGDVILSVQALDPLLVPPITSTNRPLVESIEAIVERILTAKKKGPNTDTSALESEIDCLVYKLFDLTPDEIEILEGAGAGLKQAPPLAKPVKGATIRRPRKSVMTIDSDLS